MACAVSVEPESAADDTFTRAPVFDARLRRRGFSSMYSDTSSLSPRSCIGYRVRSRFTRLARTPRAVGTHGRSGRAGVHCDPRQPRNVVQKVCFGAVGDIVGLCRREGRLDGRVDLCSQGWPIHRIRRPVTCRTPSTPATPNRCLIHELRTDRVHKPRADLHRGRTQHAEDCHGDDEADSRVSLSPAQRDSPDT